MRTKWKLLKLEERFQKVINQYSPLPDESVVDESRPLKEEGGEGAEEEEGTIRKYQALRNFSLVSDKPNILEYYMEIVCQYGFIVLFTSIFPPAALMSGISNWVQIKNQVNNMGRIRRFKAEVSDGIGNWMQCIQVLSQLSIIVNCAVVYFTSHYYKKMFVRGQKTAGVPFIAPEEDWDYKEFLVLVLAVEHGMMILKIILEQVIDDTPFNIA